MKNPPLISCESLDRLQNYLNNVSNQHMKGIAKWLRVKLGRKAVEPGYKSHLVEKGQLLSDLYNISHHNFDIGDGKQEVRPVVWGNAEALISAVADARDIGGELFIKVMADGGQGFLKICATVMPPYTNPEDSSDMADLEARFNNLESPPMKRSLYKGGGGIGNYKLSSVKRVILICLVPECKETHRNMKILFELTELNKISFIYVSDFKLLLTTLGCQTASASYPCPYCLVPLKDITTSVDVEADQSEEIYPDRSFGLLNIDQQRFSEIYSERRSKAKLCNSTVETSLLKEDPEVLVLDKCPPEELHCLQGFVNHTFLNGYAKVLESEEKALKFPQSLNVIAKDYHGKCFEGNACRSMLRNCEKMMDRVVLGNTSPLIVLPYVRAYRAMDNLVHHCFGSNFISVDIGDLLKEVIISYMELGLSVTLKMHVIFYHILPALSNPVLKSRGLGVMSG